MSTRRRCAQALETLNGEREVAGVLVQMPLPPHLPQSVVIDTLAPAKDIDGITPYHAGRLLLGLESLVPNTPAGGLELLRRYDIPLAGRRAVVVGRSNVVGKPMALLLLREHCTVTLCHSRTTDLAAITRAADILVVAIGRPGFITAEHIKPGAVVIDFGINVLPDGQIVGDVDYAAAREVARRDHAGAGRHRPGDERAAGAQLPDRRPAPAPRRGAGARRRAPGGIVASRSALVSSRGAKGGQPHGGWSVLRPVRRDCRVLRSLPCRLPAGAARRPGDRLRLEWHGRLLDLGCGTGQLAIPLRDRFEAVVGVDASAEMIAEARRQAEAAGGGGYLLVRAAGRGDLARRSAASGW